MGWRALVSKLPRLSLGKRLLVIYQMRIETRLFLQRCQDLGSGLVYPVQQRFQVTADHGERRPELVGDVSHQIAT